MDCWQSQVCQEVILLVVVAGKSADVLTDLVAFTLSLLFDDLLLNLMFSKDRALAIMRLV